MHNSRKIYKKGKTVILSQQYLVVSVSTYPPSLQKTSTKSMLPISQKFGGIIIRGQINPIPGGSLKVH
jgi:hypothetical protein